jgi:hypothetical protein
MMGAERVCPTASPEVLAQVTVTVPLVMPVGLSTQLLRFTALVFHESLKRVFHVPPFHTWNVHPLLLVDVKERVWR